MGKSPGTVLTPGKPRTDASASAMERPERNSGLQVKAQRRGHHIREELKLFPACTFHRGNAVIVRQCAASGFPVPRSSHPRQIKRAALRAARKVFGV